MKTFIVHSFKKDTITQEKLIEVIQNNVYKLDDFESNENYRCGFSPIHKKLENLFIDGQHFIKAQFKTAQKTVNKKYLADLVRKRKNELKEQGIIDIDIKSIEEALYAKLQKTSEVKFKEFEVIFDTKNNLIYTGVPYNIFETIFYPFLSLHFEGLKLKKVEPLWSSDNLCCLIQDTEKFPEGFSVGTNAELERDGEEGKVTFKDCDLYNDDEFLSIIQRGGYLVNSLSINIKDKTSYCSFKIKKNGLPSAIKIVALNKDCELDHSAKETSDENKELTKEQALYDGMYTNAIIEIASIDRIKQFMFITYED